MPLTFPVPAADFIRKLKVVEARFWQERQDMASGTGGGELIVSEIAPPRWRAEIACARARLADVSAIEALVEAIGPQAFHVFNPRVPFPRNDPDGAAIAGFSTTLHSVSADRRSIRIAGLPAGYVIAAGDMLSCAGSGRIALHRAVNTVTASATGLTPSLDVTPAAPGFAVAGMGANLARPTVLMRFLPGSYAGPSGGAVIGEGISFSAVEVRS